MATRGAIGAESRLPGAAIEQPLLLPPPPDVGSLVPLSPVATVASDSVVVDASDSGVVVVDASVTAEASVAVAAASLAVAAASLSAAPLSGGRVKEQWLDSPHVAPAHLQSVAVSHQPSLP